MLSQETQINAVIALEIHSGRFSNRAITTIDFYVIYDRCHTVAVIPAKAGIQTINECPHEVGQHLKHGFVRFAEFV
jgi:hypothetical protein